MPQITTARREIEDPSAGERRGHARWAEHEMLMPERERHTLVLARLAGESLYVSGGPGTGKSTFCRWVTWLVAEGAIPAVDVPGPDEFAEVLDDRLHGRLPILLRLREFWGWLPPKTGAALTVSDLEEAMGRLNRLIPLGERHLRRALADFLVYYHRERNHQGLGNDPIDGVGRQPQRARVQRSQRLGGLLNYYYGAA